MAILVTGGAGYIGSVTVGYLVSRGEKPVVLDDLRRGHCEALNPAVPFYQGDIGDDTLIAQIAREHEIESCIHFAALAYVGESVKDPKLYYQNNVQKGITLIGSLLEGGVRRFVFSSSCATYGDRRSAARRRKFPAEAYESVRMVEASLGAGTQLV